MMKRNIYHKVSENGVTLVLVNYVQIIFSINRSSIMSNSVSCCFICTVMAVSVMLQSIALQTRFLF